MPRAVGVNKAMEFSPCHDKRHAQGESKSGVHTRVQVTPFYQASTNKGQVGEYFGPKTGSNAFSVGKRYDFNDLDAEDFPVALPLVSSPADVDSALMTGFETDGDNIHQFAGNVKFNPDQEVWGARVDLEYFAKAHKGLYFHIGMPFASVSNTMNMTIANDQATVIAAAGVQKAYKLADYFAGKVSITDDPENRRDPLTKSKIGGRHSVGGLADIDFTVGFRKVASDRLRYSGNVRLTLPTGNRPSGDYLFEPVLGNGHHVGLGAGWDLAFQMWKNENCKMWIDAGVQYKYLFKDHEARMLGVKGFANIPPMHQYGLMGTRHGNLALILNDNNAQDVTQGVPLFPAANELTRSVNVTPGSMIDALLDVSFQVNSFVFDVGYNLYWKAREKVAVRSWEDNTYGLLGNTLYTDQPVAPTIQYEDEEPTQLFIGNAYVNRANLDTAVAETPDQLTHKMHVGMNYYGCCFKLPMHVGVGGSFEFSESNAAFDQYAVWLKGGIAW